MLSSHDHPITGFLREHYGAAFITFKKITFKGAISVFIFLFKTEAELEAAWDKISGNIAGNYQSELSDQFAIWNIYIFFLCPREVSLALKYKIENDRFSSRKIVLDNNSAEVSDIGVEDIVRRHITNQDIQYDPETNSGKLNLEAGTDSLIWETVKTLTLKPGKQNFQDSAPYLSAIEAQIKHENQQS